MPAGKHKAALCPALSSPELVPTRAHSSLLSHSSGPLTAGTTQPAALADAWPDRRRWQPSEH